MISYVKRHLTIKIFLLTAVLLLAISMTTYSLIALFAPKSYMAEVDNNLDRAVRRLVTRMELRTLADSQELLLDFSQEYKAIIQLADADGNPVDAEVNEIFIFVPAPETGEDTQAARRSLTKSYEVRFQGEEGPLTLTVLGDQQAANLFKLALRQVFPPLFAAVLLIALAAAVFYSRYVTYPVIQLSGVSKQLAALDFDVDCAAGRTDELGALAENLNELSRRLAAALAELQQKNTLLEAEMVREKKLEAQQLAFFSAVSHEMKTPITVLKGQLQGMLYQVGGYKDRDKYLRRAYEVAGSMEQLVKEILTISKMKSSGFGLRREYTELTGLVSGVLDTYEDLLLEKQLSVVKQMGSPVFVAVDRGLFTKVISNLLANSVQYSPRGAKIRITATVVGTKVNLSVVNSGVQIPDSEIPMLFEAFRRREQSRSRESGGSGLGLYIVKMILELHEIPYRMKSTETGVSFELYMEVSENT